jgi:hypothetical protein
VFTETPGQDLPAIFAGFFWLGVTSFGGNTAAWLYNQIVQRRHWVTDAEFLSGVALGRIMPGSGGVNLTVLVGQRLRGSLAQLRLWSRSSWDRWRSFWRGVPATRRSDGAPLCMRFSMASQRPQSV